MQRGIDPHVDDPDHCHVSTLSPNNLPIANNIVESFRRTGEG